MQSALHAHQQPDSYQPQEGASAQEPEQPGERGGVGWDGGGVVGGSSKTGGGSGGQTSFAYEYWGWWTPVQWDALTPHQDCGEQH